MTEAKVNLSLLVPGAGLPSEQECSKNPKESYDHFSVKVKDTKVVKGKKVEKTETIHVAVRKSKTIRQNIKLSQEAYDYMINECLDPKLRKTWKKLSVNQKLQHHCRQIAESLGAIDFSFEVLED